MSDFIKGIIIFITTITLPISGLFAHSKPIAKPNLMPTPTISISTSPTPKNSPSTQTKETSTKPSVSSVDKKLLKIREEMQRTFQQKQEELNRQPTPTLFKEVITTVPQIIIPTSTPTPIPSYSDLHCPKVVLIEDNLGNTSTGGYLSGTFKKGSINSLTVKVTATDPQSLQPYFQYQYTNFIENRSKIGADWSQNNSFTYDVTDAVPGVSKIISVYIDNQDRYRCSGGDYDVAVYFNYTIIP